MIPHGAIRWEVFGEIGIALMVTITAGWGGGAGVAGSLKGGGRDSNFPVVMR